MRNKIEKFIEETNPKPILIIGGAIVLILWIVL